MNNPGKFQKAAMVGSALAGEVFIDAHMHFDRYYNFLIPQSEPTDLIASAARLGIQKMYGSSLLAIRGDAQAGNNSALALHRMHPNTFFPYLVFKPNYPEEAESTIAQASSEKIRHFKIHDDGNDVPYDDKRYRRLYEYANEAGGVVLVHTYGRKHVLPMMKVAAQFREVKILLGHSGITDEEVYAEAVRTHENIYLETCSSLAWYGLIERLVSFAGAERVLFGTDMPFMSPDQQIGRILFARISDDDKRKVLGLNAQKILA